MWGGTGVSLCMDLLLWNLLRVHEYFIHTAKFWASVQIAGRDVVVVAYSAV